MNLSQAVNQGLCETALSAEHERPVSGAPSTRRRETCRHAPLEGRKAWKGAKEQRSCGPSGHEGDGCTLVSGGGVPQKAMCVCVCVCMCTRGVGCALWRGGAAVQRGGGGGGRRALEKRGGSGTQNFVYQNWPDNISPIVNFAFFHDGQFGRGHGGGGGAQLWTPTTPRTNCWPEAPWGGGGGGALEGGVQGGRMGGGYRRGLGGGGGGAPGGSVRGGGGGGKWGNSG